MPDDVLGIPLHPLVVHAVVVLVPLAALGTVAVALVPRWRSPYGWLVLAVTTAALATVPVATRSGGRLKDSLTLGGPVLEKVDQHQSYAERVIWAVGALWVALLVLMLLHRAGRRGAPMAVMGALSVVAAGAAFTLVVLTGHSGSDAVWNPAG